MELKDKIRDNFFKTLKMINISFDIYNLEKVNINVFNSYIFKLKTQQLVDNTTYELLRNIKNQLKEVQQYGDDNSYNRLNEYLKKLKNYIETQSDIASNNLINLMSNLSTSSRESIVNTEEFNKFNEYLHVHRNIENELKDSLLNLKSKSKGIIFLVGSVGDGKSHLLSYLNKHEPELFEGVFIYNDATESNNPYKTAVETLVEKLTQFENNELNKIVIAINVGMLNNLNEYLRANNVSLEIIKTIEQSNIFSNKGMNNLFFGLDNISIVSFLNEKTFTIEQSEVKSDFYDAIFNKIFSKDMDNPFYKAFIEDDGFNRKEPIYQNYLLMLDNNVQRTIKYLIIKTQIVNKRIISTRALLNFLHDIIVPEINQRSNDSFLVNMLFNSSGKSSLLTSMHYQDPVLFQSAKLDKLNIELFNTLDLQAKCEQLFGEDNYKKVMSYLYLLDGLEHKRRFEMIVRLHYLFDYTEYEPTTFISFINMISDLNTNNALKKDILNKVILAIYKWKGSPKKNYIYNESLKPETSIQIGLEFKPKVHLVSVNEKNNLIVQLKVQEYIAEIEIDYNLFNLLEKIEAGYVVKEKDKIEAIVFTEFVDSIINNLESNENTIINIPSSNETYIIHDGFLGYQLEEVD
ncbi:DNA phosphorothioation-dependent restriction protein DptF [Staphylococcus petrasii]|uniref:DNA phosphorothioation-dependent restriction protein DptF n=3 Tax=Staphylococcus petrasii TaxID=1276936 RepID=UPI000E05EB3F|nr:DNA phosphorothioation-dependent restriction protein DptF [Staphylococcus petrasii]TGA81485.1 DNA phosphorothioation-dependent restriction protein DptF [Staphylococcus petrasii]SUM58964.1 DNA phosphorothioation-dependent restriction protein DptF [Staphylococcus petrasii]